MLSREVVCRPRFSAARRGRHATLRPAVGATMDFLLGESRPGNGRTAALFR